MTFAKELVGLNKGDSIEGGTFMEALDTEPLLWVCTTPCGSDPDQIMEFDVYWVGVHLGHFCKKANGVSRVSS